MDASFVMYCIERLAVKLIVKTSCQNWKKSYKKVVLRLIFKLSIFVDGHAPRACQIN